MTKKVKEITKKPEFRFQWGGWSKNGEYIAFSSTERNGTDVDVYTMELVTGKTKCVFKEGKWCSSYGFSPSGKYLAVGREITNVSNDLYLINLEDSSFELIASSEENSENNSPKWLPNEEGFFYASNLNKNFVNLAFFDTRKKKTKYVLETDWDIKNINITNDGKYISVVTNENGYQKLVIYHTKNLKPISNQTFPKATTYGMVWSNDGGRMIVNAGSPTMAMDAWIWTKKSNEIKRLTISPSAIPNELFADPELIHYKSFDGLEIPALLYLPKKLPKGRLPVIINIHGGPEGQARANFSPLAQYFLDSGYAVIFPNVRGSDGYGKKYLHLDDVEKRMDSVADIAFLHKYLSKRDEIDIKKAVLFGGSYGGFMVLAGLAFYPDLWAAGVDLVGMSNFITFLENTASYRRMYREAEYGSLKNDRKFLESISPYNHIEKIKTPLFIVHGKNDPRVPLSEAEQMYAKLTSLGKKVELLVYPDEGHGLAKLKNRLDTYPKIVKFLDSILK